MKSSNCDLLMCHSEPRKSKISKFTKGNSVLLFHSLSNRYKRTGFFKLSALFGTHGMTESVFMTYANFLYGDKPDFYEEQQKIVPEIMCELHTRQATVEPSARGLQVISKVTLIYKTGNNVLGGAQFLNTYFF